MFLVSRHPTIQELLSAAINSRQLTVQGVAMIDHTLLLGP